MIARRASPSPRIASVGGRTAGDHGRRHAPPSRLPRDRADRAVDYGYFLYWNAMMRGIVAPPLSKW